MKKLSLILTLLALAMNVAAKSGTIVVKESKSNYLNNNAVKTYVWRIDIINNSKDNYLTWLNRTDNEDGYGDINQMVNFFRRAKPGLWFLWCDAGYKEKVIGSTFLKLIRPKEVFTYYILKKNDVEPSLKKRISLEKETVISEKFGYSDRVSKCYGIQFLYDQDSICLIDEDFEY